MILLVAQWRFTITDLVWNQTYAGVKSQLVKQFAVMQALALQQTLYELGKAVLESYPGRLRRMTGHTA